MSKSVINFWLDALLLFLFSALVWSESIVHVVFPPGPNAAEWTLWGWGYAQWSDFSFGLLCALALGIVIHVMLHWPWVCGVVTSQIIPRKDGQKARKMTDGVRTLYGVSLLIVVLHVIGVGVAAAWIAIQAPPL
jgi:hypothetical protein